MLFCPSSMQDTKALIIIINYITINYILSDERALAIPIKFIYLLSICYYINYI